MKQVVIHHFFLLIAFAFVGCSSQKQITFTGDVWSNDTCTSATVILIHRNYVRTLKSSFLIVVYGPHQFTERVGASLPEKPDSRN